MPDSGAVQAMSVTADTTVPVAAPERAVRAAMRIALRHGHALSRGAAEDIRDAILACTAEDVTVVTQWGVRYQSATGEHIAVYGTGGDAEKVARMAAIDYARLDGVLVRRTVTYGPWEAL